METKEGGGALTLEMFDAAMERIRSHRVTYHPPIVRSAEAERLEQILAKPGPERTEDEKIFLRDIKARECWK